MERIKTLSLWSGILGFVVVALGAWTRLADAGLGCPDWPGCYGFVTIPVSPDEIDLANSKFPETPYEVAKAIPEVVHRYFAAALGFFIVCMAFMAYKYKEVPLKYQKTKLLPFGVGNNAGYFWLSNSQPQALASSGHHSSYVRLLNNRSCLAFIF